MTEARVVLVTAPDREEAERICRALLDERLVACGNIVAGVTSLYRWEGELKEDPEVLIVLKTHQRRLAALMKRIPELHPYEVPEVLALSVEAGGPAYLEWISNETHSAL
ncbi:MAG: divalent-cation tolerance protein CutA [Gemmatimonadota bacterium]